VVLDMATTTVAAGKVRMAMMKGTQVPDDSLVDAQGLPTNDPAALFNGTGAMQPFGKHKGYGLMVMCELLGGALGGTYTMQPENPRKGSTINNMLSIIIDPNAVGSRQAFDDEVTAMVAYISESKPAEGVDAVLVPGDPERQSKKRLLVEGITVDDNSWTDFLKAGEQAGFDADQVAQIIG
jgi:hydroxycarboxylate dehydrogenase B